MIINGEDLSYKEIKLLDFLEENGYKQEYVAVELNGRIISKADVPNIVLKENDQVEIVSFVGGG